jgi:hypothetical protein
MDVSEDEVFSESDLKPDLDREEEPVVSENEFSKLQNLSPEDLNFSINCVAEAGYAAAIGSDSILKESGTSSKSSATFDCHTTVFKVADETSREEIPCQEIPGCIWKLIQA